ncbi:hypothetical protein EJB05_34493, partial [Eragrostis curvula]
MMMDTICGQDHEEDRISALPDHLLLDILERLNDPRAAIQAGTLSRRWAHLPRWLSRLLLDVADFLPRDCRKHNNWTVDEVMTAYTAALTETLQQHSSSSSGGQAAAGAAIKDLQLSFYLAEPYLRSIGRAVGDVVECGNTAELYLDFTIWVDTSHPSYEQCVEFGKRFMAFLHECPTAFRWLTTLSLQNITFGDSDVSDLLNACNKLEVLSLTCCDSAFADDDPVNGEDVDTVVLAIDAPGSALLAIEILNCEFARIDLIDAPKLGRLVYSNWSGTNPPLRFGNVPCLDNIALCRAALHWQMPFTLSQCLSNTTTLTILYLDFTDQMIWIEPEGPKHLSMIFSNLRDVYLYNIFHECDLNWTMFVLEAAPSLNNFYIKLSRHICGGFQCEDSAEKVNVLWDQPSANLKHNHLNLLQIVGFQVDEKLLKYTRLVMERAVCLKRIHLLDQQPCAKCDAMYDGRSPSPARWRFPTEEKRRN